MAARLTLLLATLCVAAPLPAFADSASAAATDSVGETATAAIPPSQAAAAPAPTASAPTGSLAAAGVGVVPGVLLHGAGHFAMGDRQTAYRLLGMEGVGLLGIIGGVGVLGVVGGSEKLAPVYVPLAVGGMGLFGLSFLADVVGAARGHVPWPEPKEPSGALSLTAGYSGLFASKHTFSHLGRLGVDWHGERLSLGASSLLHPQLDFTEYDARAGYLVWSREGDQVTRLTVWAQLDHQDFRTQGSTLTNLRGWGELRWNLGTLLPTMQNAWLMGRLGWGFNWFGFEDATASDDGFSSIVADIGMGLMATERIGVELAYRHNKSELPGGINTSSGLAGFLGMVELRGKVALDERWALVPGIKIGSGVMPWLSVESQLF